jgi:hypothetical protein
LWYLYFILDSPGQITASPTAALVTVVEAIVKRLIPAPSRLSYLRELEEAYSQGWLLSTSELADLLGLTSGTITDYGEEFSDAGFTFTRAGKRKGGEIAWRVGKPKSTIAVSNSMCYIEACKTRLAHRCYCTTQS